MPAHPPLPADESVLIGLAVLAVTLVPLLWTPLEHFYTMGHEGAHALLAFFLGFSIAEIALDRHSNGKTKVIAEEGLRLILVGIVGYLGPSLFGLLAAKIISMGYPLAVIWLTLILLMVMMFLIARSFGFISVPIAIVVLLVILHYARGRPETFIPYGLAWLMLLSGVRVAIVHGVNAEDAHSLRKSTHLPRVLWAVIWLGGTVAALLLGGKLLVYG
jgi:hypothetical protein